MKTRVVNLDVNKMWLDEIELPAVGPTEVLIETHQASVCGSERYHYRGISVRPQDEARLGAQHKLGAGPTEDNEHSAYPMGPLGHEGGGTIVEMGSAVREYLGGGSVSVGDRVGSLVYPTYCDYWVCDIKHVQPIPEGVSFEVGCLYEPLGCAGWAAIHAGVGLGDWVSVNGVGFAGNVILQGAVKAGASMVIAVDPEPTKLEVAKQLGATHVINPLVDDPREAVLDLTDGLGVDIAVEAVGGTGIGIQQALDQVRHNGMIASYGDNYAPVKDFCFHRFHEDGLSWRGLNGVHYTALQSIENMREAYRAVQRGVFDVDTILANSVTHKLADIADVFAAEAQALDQQPSLKTIIVP